MTNLDLIRAKSTIRIRINGEIFSTLIFIISSGAIAACHENQNVGGNYESPKNCFGVGDCDPRTIWTGPPAAGPAARVTGRRASPARGERGAYKSTGHTRIDGSWKSASMIGPAGRRAAGVSRGGSSG